MLETKTLEPKWVEFSNKDITKAFVKKIETDHVELHAEGANVKIKFSRTKLQKRRNYSLHKAAELLKSSGKADGKEVKIEWKIEGSKIRKVSVDGKTAFEQEQYDSTGTFVAPFTNLVIE